MYKKILIPLDGSTIAENVLPLARSWSAQLKIPVELIGVVDTAELARTLATIERFYMDNLVEEETRRCSEYLAKTAKNFGREGCKSRLDKGSPADVIIDAAAADKDTLIMMATHGRSGINRWLLGSVAEKVLRGTSNPLVLVRATEGAKTEGVADLKSIVVPLDGSELAEAVLPSVQELAKRLGLEVILFRAFAIPYGAYTAGEGFYDPVHLDAFLGRLREETFTYLERKTAELKQKGVAKVSFVAKEGLTADEIINFARETPDNLIAMCTHGRSGVKRWVLGSVTETVVRHAGDPVLIVRAAA
jgi:nucleotide-binding universal stress UspA family protein